MSGEIITTAQQLAGLSVRSVIVASWSDNSQVPYTVIRSFAPGVSSASTDTFSIMGTEAWMKLLDWEGATLTVEYDSGATYYM